MKPAMASRSFGLKAPATGLRDALERRARELGLEGPILVLLYLDDVVLGVPRAMSGEALSLAATALSPL